MRDSYYVDLLEKRNRWIAEEVSQALEDCDAIEKQVMVLLRSRKAILDHVAEDVRRTCDGWSCLGAAPDVIMSEYKEFGFSSAVVREAVLRVRDMFFDDSMKEFKTLNCVNISQNTVRETEMRFDFADREGNGFRLVFDDPAVRNCDSDRFLYDGKLVQGQVYFQAKMKDPELKWARLDFLTVCFSHDLAVVRQAVRDYVLGGFVAKKYDFSGTGFVSKLADMVAECGGGR